MKMTIRKKILVCALFPVCILGIMIIIMAVTPLRASIISQVESSLRGTASATLAAYDQNSGSYTLSENGDVWKGGYNISRSEILLDTIKKKSGMEVTFFYGSQRIMTSVMDKDGNRILGSPAGEKIVEEVLQKGQGYFSRNVSIDGEMYYGYYEPVFQSGDNTTPIGMVFAGVNKNETMNSVLKVVFYIVVIVVLILIAGVLFAGFVANSIAKAINQGVTCVEEVATGNLNVKLNESQIKRKDEVGDLARAIGKLQSDLRAMIGEISDSTNMLIQASDSLEQTSQETFENMDNVMESVNAITRGATLQADDVRHASDNMMYMGSLITETDKEAVALNQSADSMMTSSDRTGGTIAELKNINEEVGKVVTMIAKQTEQTNASAMAIREAAGFISDIAGQTSRLSLNASIEAARAGENGKGFAVVAGEIQTLSEQSNDASGNIDKIVNELIANSEQMVEAMHHMQEVVQKQNHHIDSTEESVSEVVKEISVSVQNIRSIENKTQELEDARKEIVDTIAGLSDIAETNVASTQETNTIITEVSERFKEVQNAAVNLRKTADLLEQNIKNFKI